MLLLVVLRSGLVLNVPAANSPADQAHSGQWKKYLTSMQITQFVIDLFAIYYAGECNPHLVCQLVDTYSAFL